MKFDEDVDAYFDGVIKADAAVSVGRNLKVAVGVLNQLIRAARPRNEFALSHDFFPISTIPASRLGARCVAGHCGRLGWQEQAILSRVLPDPSEADNPLRL